MKALLIFLGIFVLLALVPLGAHMRYDQSGSWILFVLGPVKLRVLPKKEKKPRRSRKAKSKQTKQKKEKQSLGGLMRDFYPFLRFVFDFLDCFGRKLRVRCLTLHISFGGLDDPAAAAIYYGSAWAAIGSIMPQLRRRFRIQKENVSASCDFTKGDMRIFAELHAVCLLGDLMGMAIRYGFHALKLYLSMKKPKEEHNLSDKAVQKHESSSS